MNKKIFYLSFVALMLMAPWILGAKSGNYGDADFFAPDYNNGDRESLNVGEQRTFNFNCYCAVQPGPKPCSGFIRLQVDSGSGFVNEKSDVCNIGEGETCSASYKKNFVSSGTYTFRVLCDENSGLDFTLPPEEHVVLAVQDAGCNDGETRPCTNQEGVCEGSFETCTGGSWPGCVYNSMQGYENPEASCDELDNDCNGLVDDVDSDGDGASPCGGMGASNELLITGLNDDFGRIDILTYNPITVDYDTLWSTDSPGVSGATAGGEIGDLTHDGIDDFIISRYDGNYYYLELWSFNPSIGEWELVWDNASNHYVYINDIGDFDSDGFNEVFILDRGDVDTFEIWGNDAYHTNSLNLEAIVKSCTVATYPKAAGDLDNDGIDELFVGCAGTDVLEVYEYNPLSNTYEWVTEISLPNAAGSPASMTIDDMESGDINKDGIDDLVFCGNSKKVHVLTYNGDYAFEFESAEAGDYAQTCSIGDITNDGYEDFFTVDSDSVKVFSFQGGYQLVWESSDM